jgi:hypothetical protein
MIKPNLFIVGAPKCGTTALSEYLRSHTAVFMCDPKEPSYFCPDVLRSNYHSEKEYLQLFRNADTGHSAIGEASTGYIHSHVALARIAQFQPAAKIIVMLRQPCELVYAFHQTLVRLAVESETDFERAWAMQPLRARNQRIPIACKSPHSLQYRWIGSLGTQVKVLLAHFPRDAVKFIFFDRFRENPGSVYRDVLSFLGLPDDNREDFPRVNEAGQHRNLAVARALRLTRRQIRRPLSVLHRKLGFRGTGIIKSLDKVNFIARSRPPLAPEFRAVLDDVFDNEILLLQDLLHVDLSHWRSDKQQAHLAHLPGKRRSRNEDNPRCEGCRPIDYANLDTAAGNDE